MLALQRQAGAGVDDLRGDGAAPVLVVLVGIAQEPVQARVGGGTAGRRGTGTSSRASSASHCSRAAALSSSKLRPWLSSSRLCQACSQEMKEVARRISWVPAGRSTSAAWGGRCRRPRAPGATRRRPQPARRRRHAPAPAGRAVLRCRRPSPRSTARTRRHHSDRPQCRYRTHHRYRTQHRRRRRWRCSAGRLRAPC